MVIAEPSERDGVRSYTYEAPHGHGVARPWFRPEVRTVRWMLASPTNHHTAPCARSTGIAVLLLGVFSSVAIASETGALPVGSIPYQIELGSAKAFPGTNEVAVPVFLSAPEDVDSWQIGLDYEAIFVSAEADTNGTASAGYAPEVTVTTPDRDNPWMIQVVYDSDPGAPTGPLPAGPSRHVLTLRFVIDIDGLADGTTVVPLSFSSDTEFQALINGSSEIELIPGSVTIYKGDLLSIGNGEGDSYDKTPVPVWLWSDESHDRFMMGLDYEDVYFNGIDLGGGALAGLAENDYTIVIDETDTGATLTLTLENGIVIPAGENQQLLALLFEVPIPRRGIVTVTPSIAEFAEGDHIPNLLAGEIELLDHFIRGDIDYSGGATLSDASLLLAYIAGFGVTPYCPASADVNSDDAINIADPIYLLNYRFTSGPMPEEPFPNPGPNPDPTPSLDCLSG